MHSLRFRLFWPNSANFYPIHSDRILPPNKMTLSVFSYHSQFLLCGPFSVSVFFSQFADCTHPGRYFIFFYFRRLSPSLFFSFQNIKMLKMLNIPKYMEQYMEFAALGLKGILTLWHSSAQAFFLLLFFLQISKMSKC